MTDRGRTESYSNRAKANFMEYAPLLEATTFAPYLYMLYIGAVGEHADTAPLTQFFFEGAEDLKELLVVSGASHVSLYGNIDEIKKVLDRLDAFWTENIIKSISQKFDCRNSPLILKVISMIVIIIMLFSLLI